MAEVLRARCYCGNIGTLKDSELICNQCIAAGREGAVWPGDYYKRTGLFADRSGEFNPGRNVRPAHKTYQEHVSQGQGYTHSRHLSSPQEIDTRSEMYGNLILKSRVDLADLCDLYSFKVFVEVGTNEGVFAKQLLERSSRLKLYCVDHWQRTSNFPDDRADNKAKAMAVFQEYTGRVTVLEMASTEAPKNITDRIDVVYIDANHDEVSVTEDIATWYPKLRIGGILSGHDYSHQGVSNPVKAFAKQHHCDIHVIKDTPSWSWFIWKRS